MPENGIPICVGARGGVPQPRLKQFVKNCVELKRFQAKWIPVRVKKTRQIKNLEHRQ
jgi:hypothetical protein